MGTKRSFKKVGASILKAPGPKSMTEFLNAADAEPETQTGDAQMHNYTGAHLHKEPLREERLHVFIKGGIADKLMDEVYRRKKDPGCASKKASKRGVVEDALDDYFER